jgi:hypothetical protein
MTDLMGRGTEARSRATLSAAEAQAGGALRLGDLTQQKWSGLGNTLAGGIDAYVTEQRAKPQREYDEWRRQQEYDAAARRDEAKALGGRIAAGRDVRDTPVGDMLALQTDAGGEFPRTPLGSAPQPSRFPGGAPPETERDAAGNFVRAEPELLPAQTIAMDPNPYKTRNSRGLDLYDLEKITQQAMQAGVYDEFRDHFQGLEGLNTRRVSRFDAAYKDFHDTLKPSLGQPEALMSVAAELFPTFSQELGGSPRFQALLQNFERAQETGDPNVFQTALRRDSDTPIDAPYQPNPLLPTVNIWSGVEEPATQEPDALPFGSRENIKLQDGRVIEGAQAVRVGDRLEWRDPDGRTVSGVESVIDRVTGALTPAKLWQLAEDERRFPEAWRQALSREWQTGGSTYEQAIETVRRLIAELAATDPAAAASVDPAIARAYVGRLFGRPLTPEMQLLLSYLDRRVDGAPAEIPASGTGD